LRTAKAPSHIHAKTRGRLRGRRSDDDCGLLNGLNVPREVSPDALPIAVQEAFDAKLNRVGIDWSGHTCNTLNHRTKPVYGKAQVLVLQWLKDAADNPRELEAAWWLSKLSHALLLRTNDLDRRRDDPIKFRIERFLDGDWESVLTDFTRDVEAIKEAAVVVAPSTPESTAGLGMDVGRVLSRSATRKKKVFLEQVSNEGLRFRVS
jgi:hypothetical protein